MISNVTKNTKPVCLFANGSTSLYDWAQGTPTITENFASGSTQDEANYPDGLPSSFQTVGAGENTAKKFLVGDFNLLGYIGTVQQLRRQMGGIRTYDQAFSTAIGGYPKGIQLDYYISSTNTLRKVLSLIDNNTYNFLSTPSYIDGIHWAYCDEFDPNSSTAGIGSSFKPIDILRYALIEDDFRADDSVIVSRTLQTDCWLNVYISGAAKSGTSLIVQTTRNGSTKTFFSSASAHAGSSYYWNTTANNSMKVVRSGTTVKCTLSVSNAASLNVSVIALPANSPTERL